jgi:hypothetical protein
LIVANRITFIFLNASLTKPCDGRIVTVKAEVESTGIVARLSCFSDCSDRASGLHGQIADGRGALERGVPVGVV